MFRGRPPGRGARCMAHNGSAAYISPNLGIFPPMFIAHKQSMQKINTNNKIAFGVLRGFDE